MRKSHGFLKLRSLSGIAFVLTLGSISPLTFAQQAAPKDNKGFAATSKQAVDLGPEIEGMDGRKLRMRLLTIQPGGYIGLHSHADRPAVVYCLQGTDTVAASDGTVKVLHPGDTSFANKDTNHWHRNDGTEPVVLIAVDVFHDAK
jgi:quercetin dioxygenase-like cupin family protein